MPASEFSRARFLRLLGMSAGVVLSGSIISRGAAAEGETVAGGEFPIGLWWPPPPDETTAERYAEISAAGFNFVIGGNGVSNDSATPQALEAAAANGLDFIVSDGGLRRAILGDSEARATQSATQSVASPMQFLLDSEADGETRRSASASSDGGAAGRVRELLDLHAGASSLAGLNLFDEPSTGVFEALALAKETLLEERTDLLGHINVWPSYAAPEALGASGYGDYLDRYMDRVGPSMLSFDHYPLLSGKGITLDYFSNWAAVRKRSLRAGVPSRVFIQSVDFSGPSVGLAYRRRPGKAELLWQSNVSLAYGAKGIQYFTYWTPDPDGAVQFGTALVSKSGQKTPLYGYATEVNAYLKAVGRILLPLVSESVVHARERKLPAGAAPFRPDAYVRSVSGSPVILGGFGEPASPGTRYLLVVNRDLSANADTTLAISSRVSSVYDFDVAREQFVRVSGRGFRRRRLKMGPGAARLLLLRAG